jgi:cystathionine beta-lyase/cystathionine gamma-synthase
MKLADMLSKNPLIKKVFFPGLSSHTTYSEAVKVLGGKGFGAMITIDLAGQEAEEKRRRRDAFIRNVSDKIKLIPTLGDPRTILMPIEAVWGAKYPEPGMIRLSIGFEEYKELEATVINALNRINV